MMRILSSNGTLCSSTFTLVGSGGSGMLASGLIPGRAESLVTVDVDVDEDGGGGGGGGEVIANRANDEDGVAGGADAFEVRSINGAVC